MPSHHMSASRVQGLLQSLQHNVELGGGMVTNRLTAGGLSLGPACNGSSRGPVAAVHDTLSEASYAAGDRCRGLQAKSPPEEHAKGCWCLADKDWAVASGGIAVGWGTSWAIIRACWARSGHAFFARSVMLLLLLPNYA